MSREYKQINIFKYTDEMVINNMGKTKQGRRLKITLTYYASGTVLSAFHVLIH